MRADDPGSLYFHSISVNKQSKDKTNRTEDKNGEKLIQIYPKESELNTRSGTAVKSTKRRV